MQWWLKPDAMYKSRITTHILANGAPCLDPASDALHEEALQHPKRLGFLGCRLASGIWGCRLAWAWGRGLAYSIAGGPPLSQVAPYRARICSSKAAIDHTSPLALAQVALAQVALHSSSTRYPARTRDAVGTTHFSRPRTTHPPGSRWDSSPG